MQMKRPPEVPEGVYRLGSEWLNFYLVEEDGEFTLVDAGYPGYWRRGRCRRAAQCHCLDSLPARG